MPRLVNEVVVIGQRPSTARNGYYHVPRCGTCIRPTYPTPVAPAFSQRGVNNLTIDIGKAAGSLMFNSAAAATGVGAARAAAAAVGRVLGPRVMAATMEANAAAVGDAAYIYNIDLHIGSALNSGLTTYRYVAPAAVPAATLITK